MDSSQFIHSCVCRGRRAVYVAAEGCKLSKPRKGILGEGSRPDEWYDSRIGDLKFDLSETALFQEGTSAFDESGRAILSLIYLNKPNGDATETQMMVAVILLVIILAAVTVVFVKKTKKTN